jgi:N6-adenosine-specific RNA methylase IME4
VSGGRTELALPGTVTETALALPATLSFEEWERTGLLLGRISRACQWWIGDWLNYGERRYGEKYAQALDATGLDYSTLTGMAWVAKSVETCRRRQTLPWSHHAEVAALDPAEQDEWLARAEAERLSVHNLRRALREPAAAPELPPGTYAVIYADPPWRYDHPSKSESRAVENQYPTMELDAIKALPVPAADNAVLFLWATSPKLTEALEVMLAWGFEYRTNMAWVKDRIGMGYYARAQHELLLIGKRGEPAMPDESVRPPSVVHAPRTEHSAKPTEFYDLIERMYPKRARIELFARAQREGWESWGNQA